jgi:hypothetical protein
MYLREVLFCRGGVVQLVGSVGRQVDAESARYSHSVTVTFAWPPRTLASNSRRTTQVALLFAFPLWNKDSTYNAKDLFQVAAKPD